MEDLPEKLDVPPEYMVQIYQAVGELAVTWGILEASLNLMVGHIYHHVEGGKIDPKLPFMLTEKLSFLQKSIRQFQN